MADRVAIMWIRDGVLIDRMAVNAVLFAVSCVNCTAQPMNDAMTYTALIDFAFQQSGMSCFDKICALNKTGTMSGVAIVDADCGASRYKELSSVVGPHCHYFPGMLSLLKSLASNGVDNYITSAVDQESLDTWQSSEQGQQLDGAIHSILGSKDGFTKGRDHFEFVARQGYSKIIYVADAALEIRQAKAIANELPVQTIGFANVITPSCISKAMHCIKSANQSDTSVPEPNEASASSVELPTQANLNHMLRESGCNQIAEGGSAVIVQHLSRLINNSI